jgi:hypothetical protein
MPAIDLTGYTRSEVTLIPTNLDHSTVWMLDWSRQIHADADELQTFTHPLTAKMTAKCADD